MSLMVTFIDLISNLILNLSNLFRFILSCEKYILILRNRASTVILIHLGDDSCIGRWTLRKLDVILIIMWYLSLKVDHLSRLKLLWLDDCVVRVYTGVKLFRAPITCSFAESIGHPEQVFTWNRFTSIQLSC